MKTGSRRVLIVTLGVVAITFSEYYHSFDLQALNSVRRPHGTTSSLQSATEGPTRGRTLRQSGYRQLPLADLTDTGRNISCPASTSPLWNQINNGTNRERNSSVDYKIPPIIHQASPTRCVPKDYRETVQQWRSWGWDYYFHDDEAMDRLILEADIPAFPLLPLIWNTCATDDVTRTDLWRLVLLWEYGGIYADLDVVPTGLTPDKIQPSDDAYFLTDVGSTVSPRFIAIAPKHPVIYVTLERALHSLVSKALDISGSNSVRYAGAGALSTGVLIFILLPDRNYFSNSQQFTLNAGEYEGLQGRKIHILATIGPGAASWVTKKPLNVGRLHQAQNMARLADAKETKKKTSRSSCAGAILKHLGELETN